MRIFLIVALLMITLPVFSQNVTLVQPIPKVTYIPCLDYTRIESYGPGIGAQNGTQSSIQRMVYDTTHKVREVFVPTLRDRVIVGMGIYIIRIGSPDSLRITVKINPNHKLNMEFAQSIVPSGKFSTSTYQWTYCAFERPIIIHRDFEYNLLLQITGGDTSNCYKIRGVNNGPPYEYNDGRMQYMIDGVTWLAENAVEEYDIPFYFVRVAWKDTIDFAIFQ